MTKKIITAVAAFVMVFGVFGAYGRVSDNSAVITASAETSGTTSEGIGWVLSDDGTLTVTGSGVFSGGTYIKTDVKKVVIGEGITGIGNNAFGEFANMESVELPESLKTIGERAFYNCNSLHAVNIPSGVTEIGNNAFEGCSKMAELTIGSNVEKIGGQAFYMCFAVEDITIPDRVTKLGAGAFEACTGLKSIKLGRDITELPRDTFRGCQNLESVKLPEKLRSISNMAFGNCSSLKELDLPEGTTELGNDVFLECKNITIYIPSSVTKVSDYCFDGSENLTVKGYSGSYIDNYISKHNKNDLVQKIVFVSAGKAPANIKKGDVNADGTIDIEDAAMVINNINGTSALSDDQSVRADIDNNSVIDIEDAAAIINHVNGVSVIG